MYLQLKNKEITWQVEHNLDVFLVLSDKHLFEEDVWHIQIYQHDKPWCSTRTKFDDKIDALDISEGGTRTADIEEYEVIIAQLCSGTTEKNMKIHTARELWVNRIDYNNVLRALLITANEFREDK